MEAFHDSENDHNTLKNVQSRPVDYERGTLPGVSAEAKSFLGHLLERNVEARYSASQALRDPWFAELRAKQGELRTEEVESSLKRLSQFRNKQKFQNCILMFMQDKVVPYSEKRDVIELFEKLDSKFTGVLTKEEVVRQYKPVLLQNSKSPAQDAQRVSELLELLSINQDGLIFFSEWMMINMDRERFLSDAYLRQTFNILDSDHSGQLDIAEIKRLFESSSIDDQVWQQIMRVSDLDGDGLISFEEFRILMIDRAQETEQLENLQQSQRLLQQLRSSDSVMLNSTAKIRDKIQIFNLINSGTPNNRRKLSRLQQGIAGDRSSIESFLAQMNKQEDRDSERRSSKNLRKSGFQVYDKNHVQRSSFSKRASIRKSQLDRHQPVNNRPLVEIPF